MNPVYQELLKSILRKLLTAVATYLLAAGLVDEHLAENLVSETTALILGVVLMAWSFGWSYVKTWADAYFKRNLALAGADEKVTSAEQVVANAALLQATGSKPGPIESPTTNNNAVPKSVIGILLTLGLVTNIACGGGDRPNLTPVQVAAETASYATDVVQLVDTAVKATSAYAVAQGGRTPQTDAVVYSIENQLMPRARDLQKVLQLARVAQTPDVQTANQAEIKKALDAYENVFEEILGPGKLPEGLSGALATSVVNIRDLIKNIRVTFRFAEA